MKCLRAETDVAVFLLRCQQPEEKNYLKITNAINQESKTLAQ